MSLLEFINKNSKLEQSDEIVFFGGTFNPWHEGHTSCIKLLDSNKSLIILPDHSPHKELDTDSRQTDINLIKSIINQTSDNFYLYTGFYDAKIKNPTVNWISELKDKLNEKKLSLLIGYDSFISITKWTNASQLLSKLDHLYIVNRLNDEKLKDSQIKGLSCYKNLSLDFLGEHEHEKLSSTLIRGQKKAQE